MRVEVFWAGNWERVCLPSEEFIARGHKDFIDHRRGQGFDVFWVILVGDVSDVVGVIPYIPRVPTLFVPRP